MTAQSIQPSAPILVKGEGYLTGRFEAMHCPCEVLIDTQDRSIAAETLNTAVGEVQRIETKYSRYISGNIVDQINTCEGRKIEVDEETSGLLDYAAECYDLSDGLFDITSGVLRKIWRFDGTDNTVDEAALQQTRAQMGWNKVVWKRPTLELPAGFEIDLGGICKEYAADRTLNLLRKRSDGAVLVNLGGDIAAGGKKLWSVGIEDVSRPGQVAHTVHIRQGGIATSGTTKRFVRIQGEILSHILNPKTGWPVRHTPRSVTVAAKTCTEAGFWSTLALLHGAGAEAFLKEQSLEAWCYR